MFLLVYPSIPHASSFNHDSQARLDRSGENLDNQDDPHFPLGRIFNAQVTLYGICNAHVCNSTTLHFNKAKL